MEQDQRRSCAVICIGDLTTGGAREKLLLGAMIGVGVWCLVDVTQCRCRYRVTIRADTR